ncbi:ABC transporter permease [Kamptonema cortianum]|nr:ABC transporter permease [Geitlerinema splendidum]MDK3158355.1 ABC transporter permease [Kamptonema cortianum]
MTVLIVFLSIMQFATPVALASLGETIGQRSGVLNIGLEGLMLTAAYVAVVVSGSTGSPWMGLLAGSLAALILGMIQALFTVVFSADQVVAGTAVNLVGLGLTGTLFDFGMAAGIQYSGVPGIPRLGENLDIVVLSVPLLFVLGSLALYRTQWGLAVRACGEHPPTVESIGFSVIRLRLQAQAVTCLLAGLGGAYLSLGIAPAFAENMTVGRGFIALALVTFGRWKPLWVMVAPLLIGFLDWSQLVMQGRSDLPIQFFSALPYVAALLVLVLVGKGTEAPESLGVPLRKKS